jgi:dihydroorotase-like cyclic amidohydrolase
VDLVSFDVIVRGGHLVVPFSGLIDADVGIVGDKITAIGHQLGSAKESVDASGKYVFPGCVDTHTHYGHFNEFYSEMESESQCLVSLGVTTSVVLIDRSVKNMANWISRRQDPELFAQPQTDKPGLAHHMWRASFHEVVPDAIAESEKHSANDFAFHLGIGNVHQIEEMREYQQDYGVTSFKCWPGLYPWAALEAPALRQFLITCRNIGALPYVNTVNTTVQERIANEVHASLGPSMPGPEQVKRSNSDPLIETLDLQTTLWLARAVKSPRLCIVHLTSKDGVELVRLYRDHYGLNVEGEVGSVWLDLMWPEVGAQLGYQATCIIPQLGDQSDVDVLWEAVRHREITCVGTDGVVSPRATFPDGSPNPMYMPPPTRERPGLGFPSHICHFPIALDSALRRGFSVTTVAEICAANPARLMNLYPKKGTIAVGSDADLVLVDMTRSHIIRHAELNTTAPFNPWEGREVQGWPVLTMLRGRVVAREGKLVGNPAGKYIARTA